MFVKTPRNETVLRELGSYTGSLNLLNRKATAVQRQIRRGGLASYEPETQATLLALVQSSIRPAHFFDVGAHIGIYSALIASIFPADLVHVTAFEPAPDTADIADQLLDANHLHVNMERLALGDEEGVATLYLSEKAETSNSLVAGFRPSSESVRVPKTSLDTYCVRRGVHPTVMKVDVETYEAYVLKGSLQTLADFRPAFVCELLPAGSSELTDTVLKAIDELGYHVHRWVPGQGWLESAIGDVSSRTRHDLRDWLFTPDELTDGFRKNLQEWQSAIAQCTLAENLLTDPGTVPPTGWGARHRFQDSTRA